MAFKFPAYKTILIWLFILPLFSLAQTFRFTRYTTHDGLPIDNVYAAAQDDNGFIWFGTDFGIARFDGLRFTNYDKHNGMINKAVTDILFAAADSLIFISYPASIQSIHLNGRINTIIPNTGFALQQLTKHNQEYYCYKRLYGKYIMLENGKFETLSADSVLGDKEILINAIVDLEEKGVAFCTNKGLFIKNGSNILHLMADHDVQNIIYTIHKTILAVSENKLQELDQGYVQKELPFSFPKGFTVYHIAEEADGATWFRGIDKGIYRLLNNVMEEMSSKLGMENRGVNEFYNDGDGNFWICTDGSGILLKKKTAFSNYETSDGLVNNKILDLVKQNNTLFIGTGNGISVMENDRISRLDLPKNSSGLQYVFQLFRVNNKITGVCIDKTFFSDDPHSLEKDVKDVNIQGHMIRAFKPTFARQEDENNSWIFQFPFLYHRQNGKMDYEVYNMADYGVRKMYCMSSYDNKKWFGTDAGIIYIDHNTKHHIDSIGNEKIGQVFNFLADQNRLLLATEIGLFDYHDGLFYAFPKGPTSGSNYCKDMTIDDQRRIWVATWDGIFFTEGKTTRYLNTNDGLPSKTANCILYDTSKKWLYIGTDNGLSVLKNIALTDTATQRNIFINCALEGSDTVILDNNSILSPSKNNLRFYLSFPLYRGIGNISYEYKLDNGSWIKTEHPDIAITDISSGKHAFYARAQLNGGPVTTPEAVFTFTVEKPFYKTWWFLVLAALFLQVLVFLTINYYNKKAKERKLAVRSQQAEYASLKQQAFASLMNPHFIFNALNSVQHYINQQDRQSANKYLSNFATLIRRGFDASQKSFVTLDEELETIRLYLELEKMRFADKFDYVINTHKGAADEDWMLPSMVLQPFLENAVLHGLMPLNEKGMISIDATAENNILYITITDNGVGIEKSKALRSGGKHKSKGMQLIKERLDLLSNLSKEPLQLTICELNPGAPHPGTKILLVIPQEVYDVFQQQRSQG